MNLGFNEGKRERRGGWEKGKKKGPPSRGLAQAPPRPGCSPKAEAGYPQPPQVPVPRRPGTTPTLSILGSSNPEVGPVAEANQIDLTQGWLRKAAGGFLPTPISGYGARSG